MILRKLILLILPLVVLACKGDNDDIIEPNDVSNVNLDQDNGIVFGSIDPSGTNLVFKYTNEGTFLVDSGTIPTDFSWGISECPYSEASVTASFTKGIPNIARGIRDISSSDIIETLAKGKKFYILEYRASGNLKTIQFTDDSSFNEEQINSYFSDIKSMLTIIGPNGGEAPLPTCTP